MSISAKTVVDFNETLVKSVQKLFGVIPGIHPYAQNYLFQSYSYEQRETK